VGFRILRGRDERKYWERKKNRSEGDRRGDKD
jgi:hypothetical protein